MSEYSDGNRRPHLTKEERVPRSYKDVQKVIAAVRSFKGSVKTVMYDSKLHGSVFNKVYALSVNILKQQDLIEKIIEETEILVHQPLLKKDLALVLIYELVLGKGLHGESKPIMAVMKYKKEIEDAYSNIVKNYSPPEELPSLPKYARVNTLVTSVINVIKNLEECNFKRIVYSEDVTQINFIKIVQSLERNSYLIDYHFKDLLIFSSNENLTAWSLYQQGHIFIQDKSSYIPVHVLNAQPTSVVIDACAAPGMKTLHIAACMQNKGMIYGYERDPKRFNILKDTIQSGCVKICKATCADFYAVDPRDPKFSNVEYILVDPSCSGSGMVSRMDNVTDSKDSKSSLRIEKLAGFQILLLKHALLFPAVKRVVYSTCSVNEKENEFVIHETLNHFHLKFRLIHVMPEWPVRGLDHYEFGKLCLRTYPDKSLTNGFFVAAFERIEFQSEYEVNNVQNDFQMTKSCKYMKKLRRQQNRSVDMEKETLESIKINHENLFSEEYKGVNYESLQKKHKKKHDFAKSLSDFPGESCWINEKSKNKDKALKNDAKSKGNYLISQTPLNEYESIKFNQDNLNEIPDDTYYTKCKQNEKESQILNSPQKYFTDDTNLNGTVLKRHKKTSKHNSSQSVRNLFLHPNDTALEITDNIDYTKDKISKKKKKPVCKSHEIEDNSGFDSLTDLLEIESLKESQEKKYSKKHKKSKRKFKELDENLIEKLIPHPIQTAREMKYNTDCTNEEILKNKSKLKNQELEDISHLVSPINILEVECLKHSEGKKIKRHKKSSNKLNENSTEKSNPYPTETVLEIKDNTDCTNEEILKKKSKLKNQELEDISHLVSPINILAVECLKDSEGKKIKRHKKSNNKLNENSTEKSIPYPTETVLEMKDYVSTIEKISKNKKKFKCKKQDSEDISLLASPIILPEIKCLKKSPEEENYKKHKKSKRKSNELDENAASATQEVVAEIPHKFIFKEDNVKVGFTTFSCEIEHYEEKTE